MAIKLDDSRAHSEAVSCDYNMGSELAYTCSHLDPLATDTDLLNVVTCLHVTDKLNADESIKIEREHYGRM